MVVRNFLIFSEYAHPKAVDLEPFGSMAGLFLGLVLTDFAVRQSESGVGGFPQGDRAGIAIAPARRCAPRGLAAAGGGQAGPPRRLVGKGRSRQRTLRGSGFPAGQAPVVRIDPQPGMLLRRLCCPIGRCRACDRSQRLRITALVAPMIQLHLSTCGHDTRRRDKTQRSGPRPRGRIQRWSIQRTKTRGSSRGSVCRPG
jgi:hypothetical protein